MKHSWLKWGLIVGFTLLLLSPLIVCFWFARGRNLLFQWQLPKYPNAQAVTEAYGYYGGGTADVTLYYWTQDPVEEVINYYETFTLPFVKAEYPFDFGIKDHYRTVYDASGGQVPPVMAREFGNDTLYIFRDRRCHYTLRNSCVVIELLDFDASDVAVLRPHPRPQRMIRTAEPLPSNIEGGTLIVYLYPVDSFS